MHTYRKNENGWAVGHYNLASTLFMTMAEFETEHEAAWRVHFLNGGSLNPEQLAFISVPGVEAKLP